MSGASQGPGWWKTTDGQWHPPPSPQVAPHREPPPGWWRATDGRFYPPDQVPRPPIPPRPAVPAGRLRQWYRRLGSTQRSILIAVAVVGVLLVIIVVGENGSSTTGVISATACIAVVDAGREWAAGLRSASSFLAVVKDAESDARLAADDNVRYRPILEAIVRIRTDLETQGNPAASVVFLANQCG